MNETLKGLLGLLENGDPTLRCAAAQCLGALAPGDAVVTKGLAKALDQGDRYLANFVLDALGSLGTEPALEILMHCLREDGPLRARTVSALARAGEAAEAAIGQHWEAWDPADRGVLLEVLSLTRGDVAVDKLCEVLRSAGWLRVNQIPVLLKDGLSEFAPKQLQRLRTKVTGFLRTNLKRVDPEVLAQHLDLFGQLGGPRVGSTMLKFSGPDWPATVRRVAIKGLADTPPGAKELVPLLAFLKEQDYTHVVGPTLELLKRIPLPEDAEGALIELLDPKVSLHPQIRSFALEGLAKFKSPAAARAALVYLDHPESWARQRAAMALEENPAARIPLQNRALAATGEEEALLALKPLAAGSFTQGFLRKIFAHMESLRAAGNRVWTLYRDFLWQVHPQFASREGLDQARKLRREGALSQALDLLLLLAGSGVPVPQVRYEIALTHLIQSPRNPLDPMSADPAMGHFQSLLEARQLDVLSLLETEEQLKPDDLLYTGLHFLAKTPALKEFGLRTLELVIRRWPHSRAAKSATQKFRTAGLEPQA